MYQWRDMAVSGGGAVALPRGFVPMARAEAHAAPFTLVVDLGEDMFSGRWWRGAATLTLLCGAAGLLTPSLKPLAAPANLPSDRAARDDPLLASDQRDLRRTL